MIATIHLCRVSYRIFLFSERGRIYSPCACVRKLVGLTRPTFKCYNHLSAAAEPSKNCEPVLFLPCKNCAFFFLFCFLFFLFCFFFGGGGGGGVADRCASPPLYETLGSILYK